MTFGKHKGRPIDDVPADYLLWLAGSSAMPWARKMAAAELERRAGAGGDERQEAHDASDEPSGFDNSVPEATPRTVCDVAIDAAEAFVFEQAQVAGEMLLPAWMPLASPLSEAWRRWCEESGMPCRARQLTPAETCDRERATRRRKASA
jgi:hypothetical protein